MNILATYGYFCDEQSFSIYDFIFLGSIMLVITVPCMLQTIFTRFCEDSSTCLFSFFLVSFFCLCLSTDCWINNFLTYIIFALSLSLSRNCKQSRMNRFKLRQEYFRNAKNLNLLPNAAEGETDSVESDTFSHLLS